MKNFVINIGVYAVGIALCAAIAALSIFISSFIPMGVISGGVFALLFGILLNLVLKKFKLFKKGVSFTSKKLLKLSIILMGVTLSFSQVLEVGGFSLIVMSFTLIAAFGFGYLFGRLFKMNWKMSSLISAGTGICGGSAIATLSPIIKAKDSDISYAIASTFIFDIIMVIVFPIMGRAFGMTDLGYGLWAGTAVNDTSSVVAAGYAFSDLAGNFAVIVKLTRTLSIIPIALIFSFISFREEKKIALSAGGESLERVKPNILKIFPWFIIGFLAVVAINGTGIISPSVSDVTAEISKFMMVMALGAIGLKTDLSELKVAGLKPMLHGFIISLLVVVVAFLVQLMLGQM